MLEKLQFWARLPSFPHKVNRWEAVPTLGRADGKWERSSRQLRARSAAAGPARLSEGCLQWKTQPGGKGRIGIPFPILCVCLPESTNARIRWENPAQVFGIPVLALGYLGIGRCSAEPLGPGGFFT